MDPSELQELDVSPDFDRVILKPPELVGEGLSAYERYPIVSSRSRPAVSHRYSDFEVLRTQLSRRFPACVVPPLPPRTILKTSISAYFVTDPDFLETRRRGLEEFVNDVLSHRRLKKSSEVHAFLTSAESVQVEEKESWGAKILSFGWSCGAKITQAVARAPPPITKTEEDWKFDEIKSDVCLWKTHMERLVVHLESMVNCSKSLGATFYGLGVPLERISKAAPSGEVVAIDTSAIGAQLGEHSVQLADVVLAGMDRCVRTLGACAEALERREKELISLHEAYGKLNECRERLIRDKRATQAVKDEEAKVKVMETALKTLSEELREESLTCMEKTKAELTRLLKDYCALQLSCQEAMGRRWAEASERIV